MMEGFVFGGLIEGRSSPSRIWIELCLYGHEGAESFSL